MKHGDLSNKGGIKLAFRLEDTLIKKESDSVLSNFARKFNRLYGYEIDTSIINVLRRLYVNTDYNLVIVVSRDNHDKQIVEDVLKHIPFCHVDYVHSIRSSEITTNLLTKEWEYYVDDNEQRRAGISSSAAVSLKDFLETCVKVR